MVSLIFLYFYIRKPTKKVSPKVEGEEKIYTKNTNKDYFDKFRNKDHVIYLFGKKVFNSNAGYGIWVCKINK